jgi:hypothetical protein
MTYPDGIDALVNVNANDSLAAGGHAARHNSVNTALVEVKDYLVGALGSKLDVAGGKILQVVRATDSTQRTTTSASYVDASISVTITPQKSDSAILLIWSANASPDTVDKTGTGSQTRQEQQITDNSNNPISGAERMRVGTVDTSTLFYESMTLIGYATPGTTSAVTYKGRFQRVDSQCTARLLNNVNTGQLYAIEVSA